MWKYFYNLLLEFDKSISIIEGGKLLKNSTGRKLLEQIYGKGCFMERAGIREITPEQEQKLRKIKGFKKIDRTISYHHIKERSIGGEVSVENGANLAVYNHQWLHEQPPEVRKQINKKLQDFKYLVDSLSMVVDKHGMNIIDKKTFSMDNSEPLVIPVKTYKVVKEGDTIKRDFNRAKIKKETQKMIEEELYR